MMTVLSSAPSSSSVSWLSFFSSNSFAYFRTQPSAPSTSSCFLNRPPIRISNVFTNQQPTFPLHKSKFRVSEGASEDEFWAAACLRIRTFNHFPPDSFGIDVSCLNFMLYAFPQSIYSTVWWNVDVWFLRPNSHFSALF